MIIKEFIYIKEYTPTDASVCPTLFKTPPWVYLNGNTWPGLLKSFGSVIEALASDRAVNARSWADIPVVVSKIIIVSLQKIIYSLYTMQINLLYL